MTKKEQQKLLHKIEVNTFQSVMSEDADWIKDEVFQHFRQLLALDRFEQVADRSTRKRCSAASPMPWAAKPGTTSPGFSSTIAYDVSA